MLRGAEDFIYSRKRRAIKLIVEITFINVTWLTLRAEHAKRLTLDPLCVLSISPGCRLCFAKQRVCETQPTGRQLRTASQRIVARGARAGVSELSKT